MPAPYTGSATAVAATNSLVNGLVEPIALQVLHEVPSDNPLYEVFAREYVDSAAEIEEIIIGDANLETYDATGATTLAPRTVDTWARFYNDYTHHVYTTTVRENEIRKISLNPENKNKFIATLVSGLQRKRDDTNFAEQKAVLANVASTYTALQSATITSATPEEMGEELTVEVRNLIDSFLFKNTDWVAYNIGNSVDPIPQRAYLEQIRIIIPYEVKNALNIGYLANVYNLEKTELLSKFVTIDTTDGLVYVVDKRSLFRFPQTDELLDQVNAEGAFRTFFLHDNAMTGFSPLFKFAFIDASAMV